jgi:UDPglucose--hexose-1-phosphate uridylyltransferase
VIISTDRQKRPQDFHFERVSAIGRERCPFCAGREGMTPPEVLAYRPGGGAANTPGWELRVVPNKFPALQVEGTLDRTGDGMFDRMSGIGAHEVIIETPDHDRPLALQSEIEIERVLWACRERMLDLKRDFRLKYILVFKNHGAAAGATLEHPHSQLIALPIVPDFVRAQIDGARRHFEIKQRCVYCDILHQELSDGRRVVEDYGDVVAIAPYAPRFAFETWLLPKHHGPRFEDAPGAYPSLARALTSVLSRIDRALEKPPFNLIIFTAPSDEDLRDAWHWHIEIVPKIQRVAGFEWGTGFYINPVSPEEAAEALRAVKLGL